MNILLLGASGMLGSDINTVLHTAGHHVVGFDSKTFNMCDGHAVETALSSYPTPDFIVNCAAYTHVDLCETHREIAFEVNGKAVEHLARFAYRHHVPLVHFSTDYVFNGQKESPYLETDTCDPINAYGESKLAGEVAIQKYCEKFYLFRIQWLYGHHGTHFIKTISNKAQNTPHLNIVNDQWGSPTWTVEIATSVLSVLETRPEYGLYHLASEGYTHWCEYADYFLKFQNIACKLAGVPSSAYPTPAKRPLNSRLDIGKFAKTGCIKPSTWKEGIAKFLS